MTDFAAYVIIFELAGVLICVFNIARMTEIHLVNIARMMERDRDQRH